MTKIEQRRHYISSQISVLTRDVRAKICTKIEAKTEADAGCRDCGWAWRLKLDVETEDG